MLSNTQYKNITTRRDNFNDNECEKVTLLFKNLAIDTKTTMIIPSGTQLCPERRYPLLTNTLKVDPSKTDPSKTDPSKIDSNPGQDHGQEPKMEDIFYITLNQSVEIKLDSEIKIKINDIDFVVVDQNVSWSENNTYKNSQNKIAHQCLQTITIQKNTPYCIPNPNRDSLGLSYLLQTDEKFKIRPGSTIYLLEGTEVVMVEDNKKHPCVRNNVHMILRNRTKCNI